MTPTWQELVKRAQTVDPSAFGELYEMFYRKVYNYAYYRVNSAEEAEDIASQTFMKAFEAIKSYDMSKASLITWLITITSRLIIDLYRSKGRNLEVPTSPFDGEANADNVNIEDEIVSKLSSRIVRDALKHVTDEQRQVILFKFALHMQNAEIAEAMTKTEGAVKALQHRALAALKKVLETEFNVTDINLEITSDISIMETK